MGQIQYGGVGASPVTPQGANEGRLTCEFLQETLPSAL
jgi:hypothetical protein